MKSEIKDNGTKSHHQSVSYLKQICQLIQKQIYHILSDLRLEPTINVQKQEQKTCTQKNITNIKQSIFRIINAKLPQVMAIQDRYQNLVIEVGEQLKQSKDKNKQLLFKYEKQILQNDRLKIQVIEINQNYSDLVKNKNKFYNSQEYILEIDYLKNKIKQYQLKQDRSICQKQQIKKQQKLTKQEIFQLKQNFQYLTQEKQLYQKQLIELQNQIEEYKNQLLVQNYRISEINQQNSQLSMLLHNEKQSLVMIEDQLRKQIIEKQQVRQQLQKNQRQLESLTEQNMRDQKWIIEEKKRSQQEKITFQKQKKQFQIQIQQLKQEQKKQIEISIQQQEKLKAFSIQNQKLKQETRELRADFNKKIEIITKGKQQLEIKFREKFKVIKIHQSQIKQKNKKFKSENERLYEAMDQYAKEQLKIKKRVGKLIADKEESQLKTQLYIQKYKEMAMKIKINISRILKKQLTDIRNQLLQIKLMAITHFKEFLELSQSNIKSMNFKILQYSRKVLKMEIQQKQNSKKLLLLTQNSNKLTSCLIQTKQTLIQQNSLKDYKIKELLLELEKAQQKNRNSTQNINGIMQKYSIMNSNIEGQRKDRFIENKYQHESIGSMADNKNSDAMNFCIQDLDSQIESQRNRYQALQAQFSNIVLRN